MTKKKLLTPFWGNIDCCPQRGHVMVKLSGGKYVPRQPKQKVWRQGRTWKRRKNILKIHSTYMVENHKFALFLI